MESFWEGFEKRAGALSALRSASKNPHAFERVLDYSTMKTMPKPAAGALDYAAMRGARTDARLMKERGAAELNYSSGKPILAAKGDPVQTPAAGKAMAMAKAKSDAGTMKRIQHATKGSTSTTDWKDAVGD